MNGVLRAADPDRGIDAWEAFAAIGVVPGSKAVSGAPFSDRTVFADPEELKFMYRKNDDPMTDMTKKIPPTKSIGRISERLERRM